MAVRFDEREGDSAVKTRARLVGDPAAEHFEVSRHAVAESDLKALRARVPMAWIEGVDRRAVADDLPRWTELAESERQGSLEVCQRQHGWVRGRLTLLGELIPHGPDAGDPTRQVGSTSPSLVVRHLADQGHHAVVGTHLDVDVLEELVLVQTPLHRLLDPGVFRVDRLPLLLRDDLQGAVDGRRAADAYRDLFRRGPFLGARDLAAQCDDPALRLDLDVPGLHSLVRNERRLRLRGEPGVLHYLPGAVSGRPRRLAGLLGFTGVAGRRLGQRHRGRQRNSDYGQDPKHQFHSVGSSHLL